MMVNLAKAFTSSSYGIKNHNCFLGWNLTVLCLGLGGETFPARVIR
jgi:hypothetical protein